MRPSPPPSKRFLQANDVTQYELPYVTTAEHSTIEGNVDDGVHSDTEQSGRKFAAAQSSTDPQPAAVSKNRQRKKKLSAKVTVPPDAKLLVGREEAAAMVSLSVRSIDYLLANKQLRFRKIGTRTMIPVSDLQKFARMDHPKRIAC